MQKKKDISFIFVFIIIVTFIFIGSFHLILFAEPGPDFILKAKPFAEQKMISYKKDFEEIQKKIEYYSQYRKVDKELAEYQKLALILGESPKLTLNYISKYEKQGKDSEQVEMNKCKPDIDLRNSNLGLPRNQNDLDWCYAFAAADLLSYKLGQKISAADIALIYNETQENLTKKKKKGLGEADFSMGSSNEAIEKLKENGGACLEENVKSENNGYAGLKQTLRDIELYKSNKIQFRNRDCMGAISGMFPNLKGKDFLDIIENVSREELVNAFRDKSCHSRIPLDKIKIQIQIAENSDQRTTLLDKIDKNLSEKNISAFGYNLTFLKDIESKTPLASNNAHESTIVGRRFNKKKGECEYLIRNSWGKSCAN